MKYCKKYKKHTILRSLALFLQAFSCMSCYGALLSHLKPKEAIAELDVNSIKVEEVSQEKQINGPLVTIEEGTQKDDYNKALQQEHNIDLNFNFEGEIQKLRKAADKKRGIHWILKGDTLLRDVVGSDNSGCDSGDGSGYDKVYAAEDYAVQILNIYRAAKKICVLYGKSGVLFKQKACKFMDEYKHAQGVQESAYCWINKVKSINRDVVFTLQFVLFPEGDVGDINQKLRLAESYVGLDDPHYNVTTRFKIGDKQFALEDKKWLKLTSKQQSEFKNRESSSWYLRLDEFEKRLIDAYVDKFLDGAHYIPTQIRNIPGCRNAYKKRVLSYDAIGRKVELGYYYHSGTLASLVEDKTISEEIARDNWNQIVNHAGNNIEVMSLNNKLDIRVFGYAGEKHIVEQTNRIVGKNKFLYLPINIIGTFTTPIFKNQVGALLQETSGYYSGKYPGLCKYLTLKKEGISLVGKDIFKTKTEQVPDIKDKAYLKRIKKLTETAQQSNAHNKLIHNLKITGNYYADIGSDYITCRAVLGKRSRKSTRSVLCCCKGGKDRTGYMSYVVDGSIIYTTNPELNISQIYRMLANASHYQLLSSLNGGMPGRFGMKSVRQNQTTGSAYVSKQLFSSAADSTVIDL